MGGQGKGLLFQREGSNNRGFAKGSVDICIRMYTSAVIHVGFLQMQHLLYNRHEYSTELFVKEL